MKNKTVDQEGHEFQSYPHLQCFIREKKENADRTCSSRRSVPTEAAAGPRPPRARPSISAFESDPCPGLRNVMMIRSSAPSGEPLYGPDGEALLLTLARPPSSLPAFFSSLSSLLSSSSFLTSLPSLVTPSSSLLTSSYSFLFPSSLYSFFIHSPFLLTPSSFLPPLRPPFSFLHPPFLTPSSLLLPSSPFSSLLLHSPPFSFLHLPLPPSPMWALERVG